MKVLQKEGGPNDPAPSSPLNPCFSRSGEISHKYLVNDRVMSEATMNTSDIETRTSSIVLLCGTSWSMAVFVPVDSIFC